MPSADLFLRLLEEKDLVSAEVLQAARREIQRTSPPPDAVHISLWLVQGQHITAAQAERLLRGGSRKSGASPGPKPPLPKAFQPKPPEPQRPAAAAPADDLELAPLAEEGQGKAAKTKPGDQRPAEGFLRQVLERARHARAQRKVPRRPSRRARPRRVPRPRSAANWNRWKRR